MSQAPPVLVASQLIPTLRIEAEETLGGVSAPWQPQVLVGVLRREYGPLATTEWLPKTLKDSPMRRDAKKRQQLRDGGREGRPGGGRGSQLMCTGETVEWGADRRRHGVSFQVIGCQL